MIKCVCQQGTFHWIKDLELENWTLNTQGQSIYLKNQQRYIPTKLPQPLIDRKIQYAFHLSLLEPWKRHFWLKRIPFSTNTRCQPWTGVWSTENSHKTNPKRIKSISSKVETQQSSQKLLATPKNLQNWKCLLNQFQSNKIAEDLDLLIGGSDVVHGW